VAGDLTVRRSAVVLAARTIASPFGALLATASRRGVVHVAFPGGDADDVLADVAVPHTEGPASGMRTLDALAREVDAYFAGRLTRFETAVDLTSFDGFALRVLEATARVPYGSVATYGHIAALAGSARAARAVGNVMRLNPVPLLVPCHRIVPADGTLGGYGGCERRKAYLLALEDRAGAGAR
jgi:methylated-DNA-[protein]-cysteine S-methyltransferase